MTIQKISVNEDPTPRSPKNRFFIEFTYNKPLEGIGSVASFGTMSIDNIESSPFFTHDKSMAQDGAMVVIRENKARYPNFDWSMIRKFDAKK